MTAAWQRRQQLAGVQDQQGFALVGMSAGFTADCARARRQERKSKWWGLLLLLAAMLAAPAVQGQTFQTIAPLSFTKTASRADNPLPQVITVASTVTTGTLGFSVSVVSGTGGDWLTTSLNGGTYYAPRVLTVSVSPAIGLAPGRYTAQILLKSGTISLTVPVSLFIEAANATYFDELPGALTFSIHTSAATAPTTPPSELIDIRNAGSGTLDFKAATSTADGGSWLRLSATSGTAPFQLNVSVTPGNLPGLGQIPGTFTGMVLLTTGADTVSIPVSVTVADAVLLEIDPLSFNQTAASLDHPLSQVVGVANTDPANTSLGFSVTAVSGTGGNWLSTNLNGGAYYAPRVLTVSATPDVALLPGKYMAEIIISTGSQAVVVPVTLTVAASTAPYLDEIAGELSFSMQTSGLAPALQQLPIRNAGSGTLSFTASSTTADGGNWLLLSGTNGTAPYVLGVSIDPASLPSQGKVAGTFVGQVVLSSGGNDVTVPVTVTVGDDVLLQINPLSFTKTANSLDQPLSQVVSVANTDPSNYSLGFSVAAVQGTGGSWLALNLNGGTYYAPRVLTVSAKPDVSLQPGTYTAEVVISTGPQSVVVPVSLTVEANSANYFDELPGAVTFSLQTGAASVPSQVVQIRNPGPGPLNFTASTSTADGAKWINLSANSGTAPYLLDVGIDATDLPGQGKIAGTFSGQVMLTTGQDTVTIPVVVTVADAVLLQINPVSFTKTLYSTNNPLPQVITIANTDPMKSSIGFSVTEVDGTGGSWLSSSLNGGTYYAPRTLTLSVAPQDTLVAGTYTAEVVISSGSQSVLVPVSLTVEAQSATYFDALPGALTFSSQPTGAAIPSKPVVIRNAGTGALNWVASTSTADGGNWLLLSSLSGTSPLTTTVSINPTALPDLGKVAGTYTGQILFQTVGDLVTVPVTVTIGDSVFVQVSPLNFSESYMGTDPPKQAFNLSSTGAQLGYSVSTIISTGGGWLKTSENGGTYYTPQSLMVTAAPDPSLLPGVYSSEIIISSGSEPMVVPVTLTIGSTTQTAAPPTFSPGTGTYASAQNVTIATTTTGAAIYYTTDGSQPTMQSALYSAPVQVTASGTLRAIAIATGYTESGIASATYTLTGGSCVVIDNSGGFAGTGLSLNGGASVTGNLLQLTDGGFDEARSAFSSTRVPIDSFITDFTFQLLDAYAEGFTFTIQGNSPQAVGASGGGLGYQGIPNSAAVKIDLFDTAGEGYDSTGIYLNGAAPTVPAMDLGQAGIDVHNGHIFAAHVAYVNGVYTGSITDTVTGASASMSLAGYITEPGEAAFVGFTGGTSAEGSATQNILTWKYQGGPACGH